MIFVEESPIVWKHIEVIDPVVDNTGARGVRVPAIVVVCERPQDRVRNLFEQIGFYAGKKEIRMNFFESVDIIVLVRRVEDRDVPFSGEFTREMVRALSVDYVPAHRRKEYHGAFAVVDLDDDRLQLIAVELIAIAAELPHQGLCPPKRFCWDGSAF